MRFNNFLRVFRTGRHTARPSLTILERTARLAPEWGAYEVRRPMDHTNVGPYMGLPTQ